MNFMKNILFTLPFVVQFVAPLFAQDSFEGKIEYQVEAIGVPAESSEMLNQSVVAYYKGDRNRMDQKSAIGTNIIITDNKREEAIVLMEMMGQKMGLRFRMEEPGEEAPGTMNFSFDASDFTLTDERKIIAGHSCRKGTTVIKGKQYDVWFAIDVKPLPDGANNLPGIPMEYTIEESDITFHVRVTSITETPIEESVFSIPEGYTIQNQQTFEQAIPIITNSAEGDD